MILVVEDHPLYRQALERILGVSFPQASVLARRTGEEALEILALQPAETIRGAVLLLDLSLPGLSGLELLDKVLAGFPELQVVVISASDDPLRVGACLGAGISAFVSKAAAPERIVDLVGEALRAPLREQVWLGADGPCDVESLKRIHLTARQLQVLALICRGMTNRDIASALDIIEATVKAHVSAIFKELGVVSRTQALLAAQRLGFQERAD